MASFPVGGEGNARGHGKKARDSYTAGIAQPVDVVFEIAAGECRRGSRCYSEADE